MAFEKSTLLTGEVRAEYVQRRLKEGATTAEIVEEINAPDLYSGKPGGRWEATVVHAERHKLAPPAETDALIGEAHPKAVETENGFVEALPGLPVPQEYEGILDEVDVAEIRAEAAKAVRADERKKARAELLKKAKDELTREARAAQLRGAARGDMVDVYIDLAPYAIDIKLDGESFRHGSTVRVGRAQAAVLMEQMQRTWQHQEGISGQRKDWNQKRRAVATPAGNFIDGIRV